MSSLNNSHRFGTAATLLLARHPCLMVPQLTDHLLLARKVEAMGMGPVGEVTEGGGIVEVLRSGSPAHVESTRAFAASLWRFCARAAGAGR